MVETTTVKMEVDEETVKKFVQDEAMKLPDMNIAISGMAGRFPKADSISEFEHHLYNGTDMITDQDNTRFQCGLWGLPPRAGRLKDLSKFDCEFFGFTQEEANYIDFQLRILYEVVYECIIDAGLNPSDLRGSNTGVFFGLHCNEFENALADDPNFKSNGYYAQFAVKIAQYFDFRGLNITFDAACASGFVGLHNAVQAINDGLIDRAIVCSSNIPIHPTGSFIFLQMQMLSPTGYSRFLDSRADGYVKSESCVSMLIQRKDLALRNYASFMATMTSVDGFKQEGITFPSATSQEELIRSAKILAGLSTNHIEYLEAHGTGTPAGDPQESRAISNVYFPSSSTSTSSSSSSSSSFTSTDQDSKSSSSSSTDENSVSLEGGEERIIGPLLVGSVKTNMGHSEAASGLCALAKVVLMLENEIIYPGLHYDQPNGNIDSLKEGKLKFVDNRRHLNGKIIPLSCYGFGGANVHAIVRANHKPRVEESENGLILEDKPRLIVMFGRSEQALNYFFDRLLDRESRDSRNCLSDDFLTLVDTINSNRIDRLMNYRGYLVVDRRHSGGKELKREIKKCELKKAPPKLTATTTTVDSGRRDHFQECIQRSCNLILPGIGCQWPAMAEGLREYKPFWSTIERLSVIMEPFEYEFNLIDILTNTNQFETASQSMAQTFVAIIAYEIGLINIIRDQIQLNNVKNIIGHSLGEISCGYAVGLFSEREAIVLAYHMGKVLDTNRHLVEGEMLALGMSEEEITKRLSKYNTIQVCCLNGSQSVTVSGSSSEIDQLNAELQKDPNIFVKLIDCPIALHNEKIMTPKVRQVLKEEIIKVLFELADYKRDSKVWISSIASESVSDRNSFDFNQANADYFAHSLCTKVDFKNAIELLDEDSMVIELGPSGSFESQIRQIKSNQSSSSDIKSNNKFHYIKMMKQMTSKESQVLELTKSFGQIYLNGGTFKNLSQFHQSSSQQQQQNISTKQIQFPVKRQTPSLSSLFKWNHEHDLFVPRYPKQFSKSSAKSELPIDIIQDRDKFVAGHCIEGRILYPATGYLFLVWRIFSFTKRQVYDACFQDVEKELMPIEFRDVKLSRAMMLGNKTSQIYLHYEEATGKFEVKEGGSICAEGYAFTPNEKPNDLLYNQVRDNVKKENLKLVLNSDDVYKQFRISGYDYGESFRNILDCSADGRYCRVKYSGHFVAFSDSILQSIFLAVSQYAPSGGLFLPTSFEYVRFIPQLILSKLYEANMIFDKTEGSLNTAAKREAMMKMMERESGVVNKQAATAIKEQPEQQKQQQQGEGLVEELGKKEGGENDDIKVAAAEKSDADSGVDDGGEDSAEKEKIDDDDGEPKCVFEVFCDPISGIIITDGIEMRGIKATPAPRRSDNNEVLLESYQFVKDIEDPINDEHLTKFEHNIDKYSRVCNAMSMNLLAKLYGKSMNEVEKMFDLKSILNENQINVYLETHLINLYKNFNASNISTVEDNDDDESEVKKGDELYDIKKNGNQMLMSVIDQLLTLNNPKIVKEIIHKNRVHLMQDLIQTSFLSERTMRPLIELVIENTCFKKMKLKLMEVNVDDGLIVEPVQHLIQSIEPKLSLDYSLAHPDLNKLTANKLLAANNQLKTYTMRDLPSLFCDNQIKDLDLLIYKDISCYSLPKQVIEKNGLAPVLTSLNEAVKLGGYIMVLLRQQLTLAERILISMSEPELVGLTKKDLELICQKGESNSDNQMGGIVNKIEHINEILKSRCELMIKEAAKNDMIFVSKKGDPNGCTVLLFKTTRRAQVNSQDNVDANYSFIEKTKNMVLLRVSHENKDKISEWLEKLKEVFKKDEQELTDEKKSEEQEIVKELSGNEQINKETLVGKEGEVKGKELEISKAGEKGEAEDGQKVKQQKLKQQQQLQKEELNQVWLCAVQTKQNPISGLIGLMQCLKKELGSARLRCYYDCYTFKNQNEPISLSEIRESVKFNESLKRNHIWNCIDSSGNFGSFRHFTLDKYMGYDDCLCNSIENKSCDNILLDEHNQLKSGKQKMNDKRQQQQQQVEAYVNVSTRGDLSSFAWFEAPHKYLNEEEKSSIVKVNYSALNFRDIMIATGRLPLDSLPLNVALSDCLLGLEFSGIDAQGKRVMCMVPNRGIATHVLCPKSKSINVEIPNWLNLKEAATIPAVYATAIMSLICRGKMKQGESVLIHAASGGVGQAAIRLCIHYKLIIFATVGTDEKRKFLLEEFGDYLSNDRIFSSRDCKFEESIMRATHGRGVDLILNSLADDKLQASIRCLADGGRFLEIGKYDLAMNTKLELFKLDTNKSFHGILLDKMFDENDYHAESYKRQLKTVKEILEDGLKKGYVKPIKYSLFKKHQVEEAFRFMATGKHIGKVLIEIKPELVEENGFGINCCNNQSNNIKNQLTDVQAPTKFVPKFQLSPKKSYIVTGGLGGFGLELTKWLVKQGAKFILLTSRSGIKTGYQKVTVERMINNQKVKVLVVDNSIADTTNEIGAKKLLQLAQEMSPIHEIGGIFHLAMVLKDTLVENMTAEDFEIVLKPKVDTFVHLDNLTRIMNLNLDYFVAFSSVTSGKGNTGQANYGYANSCLERICEKRRQDGKHGLAIQWGAIGDVGVAFESLGGNDIVIGGTIPQRMPSCFNTLSKLLCSPFAICSSILPVNKNRSGDSQGEKRDLVDAIMHVLGIKDATKVSDQATLGELGLDSLMAVEIRQYIEREYDMTLNIQEIRSLTIAKIKEINDK